MMQGQQAQTNGRVALDCRDYPGSNCSLSLAGTEDEVLKEGVRHAIADHGHAEEPGLRDELRKYLKQEKSYSA